jgi:uncharacterized protein (DUF488 family)
VRRFPGSRKHPHFSQTELHRSLLSAGIDYVHLPRLGGRRKALPGSPNTAWRNASFRGYADHMLTEEFRAGIAELATIAAKKRTVIMCAEALWWRCHRALIADYLKSRGVEVLHISSNGPASPHPYTSAATITDGKLSYATRPRQPS